MHNGAFETIERVVDHYSNASSSLTNYVIPGSYQQHYDQTLIVDTDANRNQQRIDQISDQRLKAGINLTTEEKANLVEFLENGLLDESFLSR